MLSSMTLTCECCKKEFTPKFRRTRFCSMKCSRRSYYDKNYTPSEYEQAHIGRSNVGAANELKVAADLMLRGFDVFRALSPQCSCDLAILRGGKLLRVEVRSGRPAKNRKKPFWAKPKKGKSDLFALVLPAEIIYVPPLA